MPDHSDPASQPPRPLPRHAAAQVSAREMAEPSAALVASPTPFDEWILLAKKAPDTALERLKLLEDNEYQRAAAVAVCLAIAENDPSKAIIAAWDFDLGKFGDNSSENAAFESIAEFWAQTDLDGALEWAATLPHDEEVREERIIKGMACAAANQDPATAARIVSAMMSPDNGMQLDAATTILQRFTTRDFNMAREWVNYFPDGPIRERGRRVLTQLSSP